MYFSSDLLKEVGQYLSQADQAACACVCYGWYSVFLEMLYNSVHIHSRHQFRLFYQTIKQSSEMDDSLGALVKELHFSYNRSRKHRVGFSRHELESFAAYFHNLRVLDFNPQLWKYMRYSDSLTQLTSIQQLPDFNRKAIFQPLFYYTQPQTSVLVKSVDANRALISQLAYLSLSGEVTEYLIKENLTTSFWTRVPRVEKLVITGNNSATNINVKMIMSIGAQLSSLRDFTLANVTLPLEDNDINSITMLPLFTSTLSLSLSDVHIKDWRMITLLSLAFYRVEVLDLNLTLDWFYKEDVTVEVYETCMDAFMGFAQLCAHLKTVRFRKMNTSVFPFAYDAFFHEIAEVRKAHKHQCNDLSHQHHHYFNERVDIEMIDGAWWATIDPASSFKTATTITGLLSKAHLKFSWTGKKTDTSLFKSLKFCQHLTELHLECDIPLRHGLRIDLLMDHCSVLESLVLSNALITVSDRTKDTKLKNSNQLKSLKMHQVYLGDRLIDYLAQNCLKLDELCITNGVQEKPRKTNFIVIRMPEHRFKHIKLNYLHINPGGSKAQCEANVTLLSFFESTRYDKQIKRLQNAKLGKVEREEEAQTETKNVTENGENAQQTESEEKQQPPDEQKQDKNQLKKDKSTPEMWRFYHVHKPSIRKNTIQKKPPDTTNPTANTQQNSTINHSEALTKQLRRLTTDEAAMIANYEMTDKKWKAARNAQRRRTYTERQYWDRDIPHGAVLLVCRSVDKLIFNDLIV